MDKPSDTPHAEKPAIIPAIVHGVIYGAGFVAITVLGARLLDKGVSKLFPKQFPSRSASEFYERVFTGTGMAIQAAWGLLAGTWAGVSYHAQNVRESRLIAQKKELSAENQGIRAKALSAADLMEYVADNIDNGVDPTKASEGFDAAATRKVKEDTGQATPPVVDSAKRVMTKLNIPQPGSHGEKIEAQKAAAAEAEHAVA